MHVTDKCILCGSETRKSPAILMPFIAERIFGWKPVIIDDSWQLKTIKNGNAYSICNSLYCKNCDFLFSDIRFDEEELEKLYLDYRGESYTNLRDYYEPGYSQVNDKAKIQNDYLGEIERMILPLLPSKDPVVLDWGGDSGINTPFVNKAKEIIIYDISGKETIDGVKFASKNEIIGKHFDLIVCRQVLEHTSYPDQILNEIRDFMDSDTLLYVDVPHEEIMMNPSSNKSVLKKHWHEHINYYSEEAIEVLFKKCHLDIIKLSSDKVNTHANHSNHFRVIARSIF